MTSRMLWNRKARKTNTSDLTALDIEHVFRALTCSQNWDPLASRGNFKRSVSTSQFSCFGQSTRQGIFKSKTQSLSSHGSWSGKSLCFLSEMLLERAAPHTPPLPASLPKSWGWTEKGLLRESWTEILCVSLGTLRTGGPSWPFGRIPHSRSHIAGLGNRGGVPRLV